MPAPRDIVGEIAFTHEGGVYRAALHRNGVWTSDDAGVALHLNTVFDPGEYLSPASGSPLVRAVIEAAKHWKGKYRVVSQKESKKVY